MPIGAGRGLVASALTAKVPCPFIGRLVTPNYIRLCATIRSRDGIFAASGTLQFRTLVANDLTKTQQGEKHECRLHEDEEKKYSTIPQLICNSHVLSDNVS